MAFEAIRRAFSQSPIPANLSPADAERRRKMIDSLWGPSETIYPHWASVVNEGFKGVMGGLEDRRLTKAEEAARTRNTELIMAALGGGSPSMGGMGTTSPYAPPRSYAPPPSPSRGMAGVESSDPDSPAHTGGRGTHVPPEAWAVLDAIASSESPGYDVMYGGGRFSDYSQHPNQHVPITSGPNTGSTSTAAGRYQFLNGTWNEQAAKLGLTDFSPGSQDAAAWNLAQEAYRSNTGRDLLADLQSGDTSRIGQALSGTWTSLPGGIEATQTAQGFLGQLGQPPAAGAAAQMAAGPTQVAQNTPQVNPAILQALMDPWTDPSMRSVLAQMYAQQTAPPDYSFTEFGGDLYRNDGRGNLDLYREGPEPVQETDADILEFQQAQQFGLVPPDMSYPDYLALKRAPGTTVNNNMPGAPTIGTVPAGWAATQGPDGQWSMAPIAGGPAAAEQAASAAKVENAENNRQQTADVVSQDIDRALGIASTQGWNATGIGGQLTSGVGGTPGHNLNQLLTTIGGNLAFDKLQAMRAASPTGGALGSITERELAMLQATMGAISQSQSQEQLTDNLNRLWNQYQETIHGPGNFTPRPLMFEQQNRSPALMDPNLMGTPQTFTPQGGGPPQAMTPPPAPPQAQQPQFSSAALARFPEATLSRMSQIVQTLLSGPRAAEAQEILRANGLTLQDLGIAP